MVVRALPLLSICFLQHTMIKDVNVRNALTGISLAVGAWDFSEIEMPEAFCEESLSVYRNKLAIASFIIHYPDEEATPWEEETEADG